MNMYAYVGGDPMNASDPTGMCTQGRDPGDDNARCTDEEIRNADRQARSEQRLPARSQESEDAMVEGVNVALDHLESADVSVGADETGTSTLFNSTTGEITHRIGEGDISEGFAGEGNNGEFEWGFTREEGEQISSGESEVSVLGHSHPNISGTGSSSRTGGTNSDNNYLSTGRGSDETVMGQFGSVMVLKGTDGRMVVVFSDDRDHSLSYRPGE